jgi:hypothetical protein
MKGFLFGLALTIIIGQVPKLLGIAKGEGNFFEQLWSIIGSLSQTSQVTLALSIIAVIILYVLEERFRKVPGVLVLFIVGLGASYLLNWESLGVALVGFIPAGLPAFSVPQMNPDLISLVIPAAIGIAFVCFSESVSIGDEAAEKHNDEVDPNQELIAVAATNLGSSFVQGIGTGVSMSATHVGDNSGSRSQMTLIIAGLTVLATLLYLTGVFYYLPEFVLGVIVIFAVFKALRGIGAVKQEFGIMENTIMMTVAVAASWISSAGLVSAVPALTMLTGYQFVWWQLTLLIGIILYMGLFMAIPLKRQMIQIEPLRFPANIPTGETLKAMYSHGGEAMKKAKALGIAHLDTGATYRAVTLLALRRGMDLTDAAALAGWFKQKLGDRVGAVRASKRLVTSPAVVVDADRMITAGMRRVLKAMQKDKAAVPDATLDLEINPRHAVIVRLDAMRRTDEALAATVAEQVLDNARVAAGLLDDPRTMLGRLNTLLERVLTSSS